VVAFKGKGKRSADGNHFLKIICGAEDISYFDTFVNEWNEQGGEAITNEVREELIATAG
jgi:hypothetical protein